MADRWVVAFCWFCLLYSLLTFHILQLVMNLFRNIIDINRYGLLSHIYLLLYLQSEKGILWILRVYACVLVWPHRQGSRFVSIVTSDFVNYLLSSEPILSFTFNQIFNGLIVIEVLERLHGILQIYSLIFDDTTVDSGKQFFWFVNKEMALVSHLVWVWDT